STPCASSRISSERHRRKAPARAWRRSSFETPRWARKALMRTVESRTALSMFVFAILLNYRRNFFLLVLGTLLGIRGAVFDTGQGMLHLCPGLLPVDHDFRLEDNHIVLNGRFQQIPNRQVEHFPQLGGQGNLKFLFDL